MDVKEFIKSFLIKEIKEIQNNGHHYLSFGLISQGIEFLGACLDNNNFIVERESGNRFRLAIKEVFPTTYHRYNNGKGTPYDLYENLRCGLLHIAVPRSEIELIQQVEIPLFGNHLEIKNIRGKDSLVLVSQNFMSDFETACLDVISKIECHSISHGKVYVEFLLTEP